MTDLTALAALNRVLAEATKDCPQDWHSLEDLKPTSCPTECICQGSGRVARFPGFRQECHCTERGTPGYVWAGAGVAWPNCPPGTEPCPSCEGHTGWQVRAGGLHDALEGLDIREVLDWRHELGQWLQELPEPKWDGPMPPAPEILAEGLRLVIEVAGLSNVE